MFFAVLFAATLSAEVYRTRYYCCITCAAVLLILIRRAYRGVLLFWLFLLWFFFHDAHAGDRAGVTKKRLGHTHLLLRETMGTL